MFHSMARARRSSRLNRAGLYHFFLGSFQQHHTILYPFTGGQRLFNLTEFNPVASEFHLKIITSQELNIALRQLPSQIASFVEPSILALLLLFFCLERVGDEARFRQFGLVQIASGEPYT